MIKAVDVLNKNYDSRPLYENVGSNGSLRWKYKNVAKVEKMYYIRYIFTSKLKRMHLPGLLIQVHKRTRHPALHRRSGKALKRAPYNLFRLFAKACSEMR